MNYRDVPISFPGLFGDRQFTVSGKLADFGNGIYWYGVLIAIGLLLAIWLCMRQAPRYGLTSDNLIDAALWIMPLSIVCARLYYVIFYLDLYRRADGSLDFAAMPRVWDGGLAIYGGVIGGFLAAALFCRVKKLRLWALTDCIVAGLMLGQAIGRWGNFMNREAYGCETTLPWRMRLWFTAEEYVDVHPTFLYESLWNAVGILLVLFVVSGLRRFDGECTCFYFLWYGLGRFWIEGLRDDSLYLFGWKLFGEPIRVSQLLSAVLVVVSAAILLYKRVIRPADPERLYVRQKAAEAAAKTEEAKA